MKIAYLIVGLVFASICQAQNPIWQLGLQDGKSGEFQPYSPQEFRTSTALLNSKNYDQSTRTLTYRVLSRGIIAKPALPGMIIGGRTPGNYSPINTIRLVWNEDSSGLRAFETRIIFDGAIDLQRHRVQPNANIDTDGTMWNENECGILIKSPGNRISFAALPTDLEMYLKKNKKSCIILKIVFPVKKGINSLELTETSGNTYGRYYNFDLFKLSATNKDKRPYLYATFTGHQGFLYGNIYSDCSNAKTGLKLYNLSPKSLSPIIVSYIDFQNKTVAERRLEASADANGHATVYAAVPEHLYGHFKVKAMTNGREIAQTRIAAVRMIKPLNVHEIDASFIGLCGIDWGLFFDVPDYGHDEILRQLNRYVTYQNILQIKHERLHSLLWHFVEPREHQYNWKIWDELVKLEKANGIRLQMTLIGTPKWLADKYFPNKQYLHPAQYYFMPPPDLQKWSEYCTLVAERYGDYVKEFEIWNEVSHFSLFWPNGTERQFFETIKTASLAMKKVHPDIKIVAETLWSRQEDWVKDIFKLGVNDYVDIHCDHYPTDQRIKVDLAYKEKYFPNKPLICNEACEDDSRNPLGQVDETARLTAANTLIRNYLYCYSHGFKRIYNFELTGLTWKNHNLIGPDDTPKYTFSVFKTMLNRMAGAEFVKYLKLSGNMEMFLFRYSDANRIHENGGSNLAVICNSAKKSDMLSLPTLTEDCNLIDLMDNSVPLRAPGKIVEITIGSSPIMLTGVDFQALEQIAGVNITPGELNLKYGSPIKLNITLSNKARTSNFTIFKNGTKIENMRICSGKRREVVLPTSVKEKNSIVRIKITGKLDLNGRMLPVTRYFDYVIEGQNPGSNQLPPLRERFWRIWGSVSDVKYAAGTATVSLFANKTGALVHRKLLEVIPGALYLLDFQAKGSGVIRVMLCAGDGKGNSKVITHNFVSAELSGLYNKFRREWRCPTDVKKISITFYEVEKSKFELSAVNFIRLADGIPANRQLYKVQAAYGTPKFGDNLSWFDQDAFIGIEDRRNLTASKNNPVTAAFAVRTDDENLYFSVKVRDRLQVEGPSVLDLWKGDSIQLDFDLSDGSHKVYTVQFGFALINGKPHSYRYIVLPADDIVPSYKVGPDPVGVVTAIQRDGDMTHYEIKIPFEAIHPQFRNKLSADRKLGLTVLVNNNDGAGRMGYLQWGDGVGLYRDSRLFGELHLLKKTVRNKSKQKGKQMKSFYRMIALSVGVLGNIATTSEAKNILPELTAKNYRSWGAVGKVSFANKRATVEITDNHTGAIEQNRPIAIEPGAVYRFSYRAMGKGYIKTMFSTVDAAKRKTMLTYNFLGKELSSTGELLSKNWQCPWNVNSLQIVFYSTTHGEFSVSDISLIKLVGPPPPGVNLLPPPSLKHLNRGEWVKHLMSKTM